MQFAATKLNAVENEINEDAVELVEGTLERLKAGEVIGVAIVEVRRARTVGNAFSHGGDYHLLNSGVSRLFHRLASEQGD